MLELRGKQIADFWVYPVLMIEAVAASAVVYSGGYYSAGAVYSPSR